MKPERYVWDEGSTHRSVAGDYYDAVWDYAEQLEAENEEFQELFVYFFGENYEELAKG